MSFDADALASAADDRRKDLATRDAPAIDSADEEREWLVEVGVYATLGAGPVGAAEQALEMMQGGFLPMVLVTAPDGTKTHVDLQKVMGG